MKFYFAVVILFTAAFGCSRSSDTGADSGVPTNTSNASVPAAEQNPWASSPFSPSGDARADIEKMADRFLSLRSFTAKMEGTGTIPVNSELEFLAPDRFRFRNFGEGGKTGEMVVIGKSTYLSIDGEWQKMDIGMSVPNMRETFTRDGMKRFKDVKYIGEETQDGKIAHRYSYLGEMPGSKKAYKSDIWVNAADGTPLRISTVYDSGDLKTMDITYDYSKQVSIDAPIQ